jgi:hypothetical protein
LRAPGRQVPERGQRGIVGADRLARQQPGHQSRHLVDAEESDGLVDRFGLSLAAIERRIGQLEQGAGHADVAGDDAPDGVKRWLVRGQLALQVSEQAGTGRNPDRPDQRVDRVGSRLREYCGVIHFWDNSAIGKLIATINQGPGFCTALPQSVAYRTE